MEPIQEILSLVREIRQAQMEARQTQLKAVKLQRRVLSVGGVFFGLLLLSYIAWSYFIVTHSK